MADELPTSESAVPSLLQALTWATMFGCIDTLIAGKPWTLWGGLLAISVLSLAAGIKWSRIKAGLGPTIAGRVERIARNPLYRKLTVALVLGYFVIAGLLYIHRLRSDLDFYVMPRAMTKEQSQNLRDFLSKHE